MSFKIFLILLILRASYGLNNGLGRIPQMGWDSLYAYSCNVNETVIHWSTDIMNVTGLSALGYQYVILDDCWQASRVDGSILWNGKQFPGGIASLAEYVHSKNMKFGLSSDAGSKTCNLRPGSLHYEKQDAATFASWGVDYLKYENCFDDGTKPEVRFPPMRDALNGTGRPIFFSIREWGSANPFFWEVEVANSWRTTQGSPLTWEKILLNIDTNNDYAAQAGPGGWNDPGVLIIGNGVLSSSEEIAQFSLWSISKAPLLIGADLTKMLGTSLSILQNAEVVAVNQDPLGVQGKKVALEVAQSPESVSDAVIQNCSLLQRFEWLYDETDGSIRSSANNFCLTVANCSTASGANVVVSKCQINTPQAQCQGKNQQWTYDASKGTIVSRLNEACLEVSEDVGPGVDTYPCHQEDNQFWTWNSTTKTLENKLNAKKCLTFVPTLEVWAGPLRDGSQAVVLFNRGNNGSEPITVQWTDLGLPASQSALVRDLWAHQDLGTFKGKYTSPPIDSHSVMMFKITPTQ